MLKKLLFIALVAVGFSGCGGVDDYNYETVAGEASNNTSNGGNQESTQSNISYIDIIPVVDHIIEYANNNTEQAPAQEVAIAEFTAYDSNATSGLESQIKGWWKINGLSKKTEKVIANGTNLAYVLDQDIEDAGSQVTVPRSYGTDFQFIVHTTDTNGELTSLTAVYSDGSYHNVDLQVQ